MDIARVHPEYAVDHFTRNDGTVRFYNFVQALIGNAGDCPKVLDFGAGRGGFHHTSRSHYRKRLQDLRLSGAEVWAVDVDPVVKSHPCSNHQMELEIGKPLPMGDEFFDVIVSDFVFEHLDDAAGLSQELLRVLKPGGWICARTPNKWSYVAIAARIVPNTLHDRFLSRVQPDRAAEDIFPTVYKLNTVRDVRRHFGGCEVCWYHDSGDPAYHLDNRFLFRLIGLVNRLLPASLATCVCLFIRKPAR